MTSALALAVLMALMALPASALEPNQAVYIGGSAAVAPDTVGTVDTTSPTALVFNFKEPDGATAQIAIDYTQIRNICATNEVTHHLGVAPAIAVGLLAARERRYFLAITWTDDAGVAQAVEIEVAKRGAAAACHRYSGANAPALSASAMQSALLYPGDTLNEWNFTVGTLPTKQSSR